MLNCLFVNNEQLDLSWHGTLHLPPPDTAAATTIFSFKRFCCRFVNACLGSALGSACSFHVGVRFPHDKGV